MPALEGGSALPVTTGGSGQTEARAAVPVYVVSGAAPVIGQKARRVVVVTSGPVEGGAAIPVYDMGASAVADGDAALPVYVVSGSLGGASVLAYTNKVIALSPILYYPMAEPSGTTATDESGNARNGTYTAVTLAQTGIGDGRTAGSFDGSTSVCNAYGASFVAAFNKDEGTIAGWAKVAAAGVWTDAAARQMVRFLADGSNLIIIRKTTTNNQIQLQYVAGGTNKNINTTFSLTTWFHWALTWSKAADQVKAYINGAQVGATLTGLGTWSGALASGNTVFGAGGSAAFEVWSGTLAHIAVWNTPLSAANVLALATVP